MSSSTSSGNPFLTTSNQTYGLSLVGLQEMAAKQEQRTQHKLDEGGLNPFLVTTNQTYGLSLVGLQEIQDRRESKMPKKSSTSTGSEKISTNPAPLSSSSSSNAKPTKEEIEQALASYRHNPKEEDPLYMTTANEIGRNAPSYATYTKATKGRSQTFSNSFNCVMYTDESLAI